MSAAKHAKIGANVQVGVGLGPGAVPYELCRGAFADRADFKRFFERMEKNSPTLVCRQKGQSPREGFVDASVTLPSGEKAGAFVQASFVFRAPTWWREMTERQRGQWRIAAEQQMRFERFLKANPHRERSKPATFKAYAQWDAAWLNERGAEWQPSGGAVPASKSHFGKWRERLTSPEQQWGRQGRPKGSGVKEWHPRAEQLFDENFRGDREAAEVLRVIQAYAWREGFESPTEAMIRRRVLGMTQYERVYREAGPKGVEERCVPKGRRGRNELRGRAFSDAHTMNIFATVPDAHGGLKAVRPTLAGVYVPFAYHFPALCVGLTESAELVSTAWRECTLEVGSFPVVTTDNTNAMDGLAGSPYRRQAGLREKYARGGLGGSSR